ncbi:MAG: hypothetical protein K2X93_13930 [Candidatus Obscuribacterales bacterium]|nr:hypothetical protein [Candidatus Obscuribacterales bacterium]
MTKIKLVHRARSRPGAMVQQFVVTLLRSIIGRTRINTAITCGACS